MSKASPMFRQPDAEEMEEELRRRTADENSATHPDDKNARILRQHQVGLKITDDKADQFDRLKLLTRWSYTDIFETALDAFEDAWKKGKITGRGYMG